MLKPYYVILVLVLGSIAFLWFGPLGYFSIGERDDIKNILVEYHGLLFDVLILGILLTFLQKRIDKRLAKQQKIISRDIKINTLQDTISDLKYGESEYSMLRTRGALIRLGKFGVPSIDASNANLNKSKIIEQELNNIDFRYAVLDSADLTKSKFRNCNFSNSSFKNTLILEAVFEDCLFNFVDFKGADLNGTEFLRCTFKNAIIDKEQKEYILSHNSKT